MILWLDTYLRPAKLDFGFWGGVQQFSLKEMQTLMDGHFTHVMASLSADLMPDSRSARKTVWDIDAGPISF